MKKSNLDEMQELKLLQIESKAAWFAFWALFICMMVESSLGMELKVYLPEQIIFLALSLYMAIASWRNGIWDRKLKANGATNFVISIISALVAGVFFGIRGAINGGELLDGIILGGFAAVFLFAIIFISLTLFMTSMKKREMSKEKEIDEEEAYEES